MIKLFVGQLGCTERLLVAEYDPNFLGQCHNKDNHNKNNHKKEKLIEHNHNKDNYNKDNQDKEDHNKDKNTEGDLNAQTLILMKDILVSNQGY